MHIRYDEHNCIPKPHPLSNGRLCLHVKLSTRKNDTVYWALLVQSVNSVLAFLQYYDARYLLPMFTLDCSRPQVQFISCIYRVAYFTSCIS